MKETTIKIYYFILLIYLPINGQENNLIDVYKSYTKAPREIAYVHLNKSTYIKGEMIGFTAYLLNKADKSLSKNTTNLYVTISKSNDSKIKEKLFKVNNGISSNIFEIDSAFTSGTYTFRAYTNWMLNFNESNYFEQNFEVIDPDKDTFVKVKGLNNSFSIKAFPEGGHLLSNVQNTIGIIVKNKNGIGLPNANGHIVNHDNETISSFKLNHHGIAKTVIVPKLNDTYRIKVSENKDEIEYILNDIKDRGINMSLSTVRNGIGLILRTNENTYSSIKNKEFKITVHNGYNLYTIPFSFGTKTQVNKYIKNEKLFTGINIITIFDNKNNPLLERVYFNPKGIEPLKLATEITKLSNDSLSIRLNVPIDSSLSKFNNMSISILPKESKSYISHSSLFSKTYLEPYVKGFVQNGWYYFNNMSDEKLYHLDNLLITQGWSSYSWNKIFNNSITYKHNFENGINALVHVQGNNKKGDYYAFPLKNSVSQIFSVDETASSFSQKEIFPEEGESYTLSKSYSKGIQSKPKVYINFLPSKIPELGSNLPQIKQSIVSSYTKNKTYLPKFKPAWGNKNVEQLDEVTLKGNGKKATRIEKIKNKSYGKVRFLDDRTRRGMSLALYLNAYTPYRAQDWNGYLSIIDPSPRFVNNPVPYIILDDVIIQDFGFLGRFSLDTVEYIEINRSGLGSGIRGDGGGYIKIVTNPALSGSKGQNFITREFPLVFSAPKKFYAPFYENYNSDFFKEYGTIDWLPNIMLDENGTAEFKIFNPSLESIILNIEGATDDGRFISERKTILIED